MVARFAFAILGVTLLTDNCLAGDATAGSESISVGRAMGYIAGFIKTDLLGADAKEKANADADSSVGLREATSASGTSADGESIQVIGAGLGRTGSSSLKLALKRLGYKPYHMADGVFDAAGHIDMWMEHAKRVLESVGGETGSDVDVTGGPIGGSAALELINQFHVPNQKNTKVKDSIASIVQKMGLDGFNATTDMPACYLYRELMEMYPDARVILTKRNNGKTWSWSVLRSIGQNTNIFNQKPFAWIGMAPGWVTINQWMWAATGVPESLWSLHPEDKTMSILGAGDGGFDDSNALHSGLAQAHDRWNEAVVSNVPSDKLLELEPVSGHENWIKLCAHLKPLGNPNVNKECGIILAAQESWPWENQGLYAVFKVFRTLVYVFSNKTLLALMGLLVLSVGGCMAVACFRYCCASKAKDVKGKKE